MQLRRLRHGETLTVVGHLDELRTRMIVCLVAVAVAFGLCFWGNHRLLHLLDGPLAHQTQAQVRAGHGPLGATYRVQLGARDVAVQVGTLAGVLRTRDTAAAATLARVQSRLAADVRSLSAAPEGDRPVTLGIGEPFTTTLAVTFIFAATSSCCRPRCTSFRTSTAPNSTCSCRPASTTSLPPRRCWPSVCSSRCRWSSWPRRAPA